MDRNPTFRPDEHDFQRFGTGLARHDATSNFATHPTTMARHLTLAFLFLVTLFTAQAQISDLVFFTDDGAKFTLIIDGDIKNAQPASRVVATGIRTESPMVMVKFEDAAIPQMRKPGYFELGKEYTVMITTNKKGERVLRPTGEAELGTAAQAEPAKPRPETFVEDEPATPVSTTTSSTTTNTQGVDQTIDIGGVEQVTSVTVVEEVEEGDGMGTGENVNINMGVNGVGFNMSVKVDEGGLNTGLGTTNTTNTTVRTTTTTTTTTSGTVKPVAPAVVEVPAPVKEPEVYRMPGYSGPIGCSWPMSSTEFTEAKASIESKGFEETKMTMAKQIGRDRCFTVEQVKGIMGVFGFEDTKLDFAKYAYERTYDIGNYYKVNDAFSFETSVEELNEYIQAR
jgi:hypothetical protein